ncbi:hypothetical protein AA0113_g11031 [Alternaria arborescens]|uniref:HOOK N-terminal domain-containing protein n=4 Tax=Alternaria sect. Alternaria TaxID=2499237 RepID=A0A4Q4NCD8_ALTAL|nr:hypothetical protein AG0111_0g7061 [Alternaria gaisen]RYN37898.1 hypothetical protein AA0112_g4109 [Alternaria arborescens]RYN38129.1 hypothetical protein AA0114_g11435 [Alternaria tenuissima]RYN73004.1 hypothetical protein AA0117_g8062 [Alternaria alternata]RYN63398.1 hypothetical protein AA0118_g4807 [Alternaria tenuissima]
MDDFKPELLKALLDWVNTFDLPHRITSLTQLEDGQILWQILADIDADYFNESLPNFEENHRRQSDNWIPRWQNLKYIERTTSTYIREECEQLPVLTKRMIPDLKAGARDGSTMLVAKLTMAVLLAACFSPRSNQRMLQVMPKLGQKTAETIAEAIQEMQALDQRMSELGVDAELTSDPVPTGYRTPTRAMSGQPPPAGNELEQEAQLFEANKDRQALKAQVGKLLDELKVSRERIAKLEEEVAEATAYLDVRAGQAQRAQSDDVENLRNDLLRDRQYIDQLEQDLVHTREIMESQKRRLDRLEGEEGSKQDLRDQLQLVKAERDELSQKAKANENLKKKIESLTKETKQLETLREDYQQARERLAQLEQVEERNDILQNIIKENGQTLANGEQAIFEEKGKRTRVEHENLLLMKQLEQTRELQYKAEDAKQELEERIRELESSNHADRGDSLEDELTQDEQDTEVKPVSDGRVSADAIALQQRVDILNARLKSLESETLKQMQENLGLRSDMMAEKDENSQKPFLEQNEKLTSAQTELEELRRRLREQDLQMAELRNELNRKSDIDDDTRSTAIQKEQERLLVLQERTNDRLRELELANAEKSGLLRAALLDRQNLPPELLELKRVETIRQMRERIESVIKAPPEVQPQTLDTTSTEIAETVLSAEAALEKAKKDLQDQLTTSSSLREQLEVARKETSEKGSVELQQEVENLRRENALVKSMWYDMNQRLLSNTVILQRRSEAPKGWLGKQRAVVGGGSVLGRR